MKIVKIVKKVIVAAIKLLLLWNLIVPFFVVAEYVCEEVEDNMKDSKINSISFITLWKMVTDISTRQSVKMLNRLKKSASK